MRKIFILICFLLVSQAFSQILKPVKWSFFSEKTNDSTANLYLTATIDKGWHIYSQTIVGEGPVPTSFTFEKSSNYQLIGKVYEPKGIEEFDKGFEINVTYFEKSVTFVQKTNILSDKDFIVKGTLTFMACEKMCLPPADVDFSFNIKGYTKAKPIKDTTTTGLNDTVPDVNNDSTTISTTTNGQDSEEEQTRSLWIIFLLSLLAGFAAIITPCVFPMIPMTVSFFIKRSEKKSRGIKEAFMYGFSIIVIYVALGLGVSLLFGANALNSLASNAWFNIFLFLLLIIFAASFFGAFELTLPSKWVNAMDRKADKSGGYLGVFFMGLTFVLVSFSCTSPIIGTLLVETAVSKSTIAPLLGMLGFSTALAIPFTLFAIFPSWLKNLPKSGGWLNSVKVTLAFILLAFSFKFLSTASLVNHWGIIDREVFLVLWIVIFALLGFYLLGKLKFSHDSDLPHVSVTRLFLATVSLAFALYLVPGLWGAPLKAVSAFLPPLISQDFVLTENGSSGTVDNSDSEEPKKYADIFECPHGLNCFFDFDEGLACAKKVNKPVFLDFTGWACTNCKKMETSVLSDKEVLKRLNNDFVMISLYVDDKTSLPEAEQFISKIGDSERKIKT
ncbi:MAG: cytochrome c biogenesis protein CcdA, partial [Bacteroidota bacterium]